MGKKNKISIRPSNIVLALGVSFFILFGLFATAVLGFDYLTDQRIMPGVRIGDQSFGRLRSEQALEELQLAIDQYDQEGLTFTYLDDSTTLTPSAVTVESSDIAAPLLLIDTTAMVEEAYAIGRSGDWLEDLQTRWTILFSGTAIPVHLDLYHDAIVASLQEHFRRYEQPAKNATLATTSKGAFTVIPSQAGRAFDWEKILNETRKQIEQLQPVNLSLSLSDDFPEIHEDQVGPALELATEIVARAPYTIRLQERSWTISSTQIQKWLGLIAEPYDLATEVDDDIQSKPSTALKATIGFNEEPVLAFLQTIAKDIDHPAQNGKYERKEDGTIVSIQESSEGQTLNIARSLQALEDQIIREQLKSTKLVVDVEQPTVTLDNINNLDIIEVIGVGESNFKGSQAARVHNIEVGRRLLHGQIIAPGETFSMNTALNHFNPEDGWGEAYVIRGDETVLDIGGGGCQFGTTMFRAALNSGLPIDERRNHAYVVSYYYPIGTDATIFDPGVDFKFLNDTGHHMLIQAEIEKTILRFTLWGKKDGRIAEHTEPTLSNWREPPPKIVTETDELPPGEEKCTEKPRRGVNAAFDYSIRYPDGQVEQKTFRSAYRAWPERCKVGRQKPAEPASAPSSVPVLP
jgi:vancomycin resistance protein YoaR